MSGWIAERKSDLAKSFYVTKQSVSAAVSAPVVPVVQQQQQQQQLVDQKLFVPTITEFLISDKSGTRANGESSVSSSYKSHHKSKPQEQFQQQPQHSALPHSILKKTSSHGRGDGRGDSQKERLASSIATSDYNGTAYSLALEKPKRFQLYQPSFREPSFHYDEDE
jgi:hypothetical protein